LIDGSLLIDRFEYWFADCVSFWWIVFFVGSEANALHLKNPTSTRFSTNLVDVDAGILRIPPPKGE
jgi:hypothetical protein